MQQLLERVGSMASQERKTGRIDLRLEEDRKGHYEQAASLKGQTLTQWTLLNLDAAAARDIEEAQTTRLSGADFDRFCELLDQPMPEAAVDLLRQAPSWVDAREV